MGVHPAVPSKISSVTNELLLSDFIASAPEDILGASVVKKFGETLPFLFKVLSIASPLSIQAHPDKELAAKLHAKDPKNYPDLNHKPEIAIAVTPLLFLAVFRPIHELKNLFVKFELLQNLLSAYPVTKIQNGLCFFAGLRRDRSSRGKTPFSRRQETLLSGASIPNLWSIIILSSKSSSRFKIFHQFFKSLSLVPF